jgi:hypothetical protein
MLLLLLVRLWDKDVDPDGEGRGTPAAWLLSSFSVLIPPFVRVFVISVEPVDSEVELKLDSERMPAVGLYSASQNR